MWFEKISPCRVLVGTIGYRYEEECSTSVRAWTFELNGMPTIAHLNVFPLGSHSMLWGMDWLYLHKTKVYLFDKAIECVDDSGEKRNF